MKFRIRTASLPLRSLYIRRSVPFLIFALGCAITSAAVTTVAARQQAAAAGEFRSDALAVQRVVQVQLDTIGAVTHAAAALLGASPEINFSEFRAFVYGLELRERYPGLDGIGFAPRVETNALRSFVRSMKLDGVAVLNVRPVENRAEYFPAVMVEPADRENLATIGFDLAAEPVQAEAMSRARDSNAPAITALLEPNAAAGRNVREFVLYQPIYRRGARIDSLDGRREALMGFAFSRLRPDAMFGDTFAAAVARSLDISIYDTQKSAATLLVTSGEPDSKFQSDAALSIGGRQWLLAASSRAADTSPLPPEAQRVLVTGLFLSLLLFALMRLQVNAWQTAAMHAAQLSAADRAKDEFLAVLSHELRTPINAMLGWLSMVRNGSVRADRQAHALEVIERNARSQAQLIDDLLEVSSILMGKMPLNKRPLSVVPAVTSVVDSLRPMADANGVALHSVDPADAEPLIISADVGRFAQIITNLVNNGMKFTPADGAVWVNVETAGENVKITVRDTGIGIAPEFLPHVFDRFRQADTSTTRSYGGLGMGLAIVRHLVLLHGGHIEANSKGLNQGTSVIVTLPLCPNEGSGAEGTELALAGT
jgi:signal transduction histidine kinase